VALLSPHVCFNLLSRRDFLQPRARVRWNRDLQRNSSTRVTATLLTWPDKQKLKLWSSGVWRLTYSHWWLQISLPDDGGSRLIRNVDSHQRNYTGIITYKTTISVFFVIRIPNFHLFCLIIVKRRTPIWNASFSYVFFGTSHNLWPLCTFIADTKELLTS
jgi:hypothetical protein